MDAAAAAAMEATLTQLNAAVVDDSDDFSRTADNGSLVAAVVYNGFLFQTHRRPPV